MPKGHIEPEESIEAAALRELGEEAGIAGEIVTSLGPPGPRTTRSDGKANVRTRITLLNSLSPLSTSKVFS